MKIITTDDKSIKIALLSAVNIGHTNAKLIFTDKEKYTHYEIKEILDNVDGIWYIPPAIDEDE